MGFDRELSRELAGDYNHHLPMNKLQDVCVMYMRTMRLPDVTRFASTKGVYTPDPNELLGLLLNV